MKVKLLIMSPTVNCKSFLSVVNNEHPQHNAIMKF